MTHQPIPHPAAPAAPSITSRHELDAVVENIVQLQLNRAEIEREQEQEIASVRQKFRAPLAEIERYLTLETSWVETWARNHPEAFRDRQSMTLTHAAIGFRVSPHRVDRASRKWTWGAIAQKLGELAWGLNPAGKISGLLFSSPWDMPSAGSDGGGGTSFPASEADKKADAWAWSRPTTSHAFPLIMTPLTRSCLLGVFLLTGSQAVLAQTYYAVQQIEEAKAQAHAKHLPIAWMSSQTNYLEPGFANEAEGSPAELTMLALRTLQGQAVIIFQNVDDDLPFMPANMIDRIETKDEGNTPPHGDHYTAPKIIYTDPDLKTFFGCTLAPDLRSDREAAINIALLHIRNDPQAQALINGTAVAAAPPVATPSVPAVAQPQPGAVSTMIAMGSSGSLFVYAAGAMLLLLAGVAFLAWRSRP